LKDKIARNPIATAATIITCAGAATLVGAWIFQYGFGLEPCPLCLEQRIPYYIAVPLAALIVIGAQRGLPARVLAGALVIVALTLLWGTYLGIYHSGVEWKWWAGPQDCSGAGFSAGGNLLKQIQTTRVIRCDEAAWRFLGLSLAGYNVVITLALAAVAGWAALQSLRVEHRTASNDGGR
jgi:disulfide bond formation protein DsbB